MGNCLIRNNQISAQDEKDDQQPREVIEQMKTPPSSILEPEMPEESLKKKKIVRFKLKEDEERSNGACGNSRSGIVRVRLVVTKEELQRILSCENDNQQTSLEQLLSSMKLRGSRICEVGEDDDGVINAWRPTLESIPEDRSMK